MKKFFRVIHPSNSSFYNKVGVVIRQEIYPKTPSTYGISYKLNFAIGKNNPGPSDQASFYDYQLIQAEDPTVVKNTAIQGSQERLI